RTLQPHPARRMGLRTTLDLTTSTHPRVDPMAAHLQPSPPPHRDRQLTHHPRQQPHRAEQLADRFQYQFGERAMTAGPDLERTRALADLSRALAEAVPDVQAVLDEVARHVAAVMDTACEIRLLSDDGEWLLLGALFDRDPERLAVGLELLRPPQRATSGMAGQAGLTREPFRISGRDPHARRAALTPE